MSVYFLKYSKTVWNVDLTSIASGLNMNASERIQLGSQVMTKQKIMIRAIFAIFQLTLNSLFKQKMKLKREAQKSNSSVFRTNIL